jgi:lipopolysaccharide/colanic/teichoic acid biosynthesis glycosyltransferase
MGSTASTPAGSEPSRSSAVWQEEFDSVALTTSRLRSANKRAFDASMALLMIVALLPLLVLIAVTIKLDSRGPVFYRVRRVGYRGVPLMMLKFRKMAHDATGIPLTAHNDDRLTRIGKVLARTRLDELPQLWDVLRGRMSLVGPRPEDQHFVSLDPHAYERILTVRPGMTGLSQLAYAEEHKILKSDDLLGDYAARILPQKITLDTLYARTYSFRADCGVIAWTVVAMLLRKPLAVHRTTGAINIRRRPPQGRPIRYTQSSWQPAPRSSNASGAPVFAHEDRRAGASVEVCSQLN